MILEVLSSIRQEVNKYKFSCDDDVIQCYILEITCGVILVRNAPLFKSVKQNLLFSSTAYSFSEKHWLRISPRYNSTLSRHIAYSTYSNYSFGRMWDH